MTQEFGAAGANEIGKAHEGIGPYAAVEAIIVTCSYFI